jgi:hypothetical protein
VGQNGQIGGLVLRALAHERPAVALASLHPAPRTVALLSQLFVVALRRCFAGHDTREVTAYVRDLLGWLELPSSGREARETEALIRAALGEPALAVGIPPVRRHEIVCAVVGDLVRPPGVDPQLLGDLVTLAESRAGQFS